MPLYKKGDVIVISDNIYVVDTDTKLTQSCDECVFQGTNMCAGGVGRVLKNYLSCEDLVGPKGNFKKLDLKRGV